MRVLVTGSRYIQESRDVWKALDELDMVDTIIHGAAPGVDTIAENWAREHQVHYEGYPAKWTLRGKAAGPIRNALMVRNGADLCIAFFKTGAENKGTYNCVKFAKYYGIPVREIWL